MTKVFHHQELEPQGFFRSLIGRPNPDNGYVELRNILAARPWSELTENDVATVLQRHGVKKADRELLRAIYARAVYVFANDNLITDDEAAQLDHLKRILGITASDLDQVERDVLHPLFDSHVGAALSDSSFTPEEKAGIERIRRALRIDERSAANLFSAQARSVLEKDWNRAIKDGRLGEDEEAELAALAGALGVNVSPGSSWRELDRMRALWRIEQGRLPLVGTSLKLHRNEECYFAEPSQHWERRTVTERINYGGPTVRIRIMKGVYYRAGSIGVQKVTREVMKQVNTGTLHVTSKRLIFRGDRKNTTVTFASAIGFIPYSDAIEIEKATGRNPIFTVADPEMAGVILGAAMARA